jgi:hypothetical protein
MIHLHEKRVARYPSLLLTTGYGTIVSDEEIAILGFVGSEQR